MFERASAYTVELIQKLIVAKSKSEEKLVQYIMTLIPYQDYYKSNKGDVTPDKPSSSSCPSCGYIFCMCDMFCPSCGFLTCNCRYECSICGMDPCTCTFCPSCDRLDCWGECLESGGSGGGETGGGENDSSTNPSSQTNPQKITTVTKWVASSILGRDAQCSEGIRRAFKQTYENSELEGKNANAMVNHWKNSDNWEQIAGSRSQILTQAQSLANEGYFVVAGWLNPNGSGHVVVIVPGNFTTGTWYGASMPIPVAMDTGANMRSASQGINYSFGKNKQENVVFYYYK